MPYRDPCDDDDENDSLQRQLINRQPPLALQYRAEVVELADGQFYWHLYRRDGGERVNGGIAVDRRAAYAAASMAADVTEVRMGFQRVRERW